MSTELVPFSISDLPAVTDEELGALDNVKANPKFLPRLQLAASSCELCKTGKCMPGNWVIPNGTECTILGDSIDVMPIAVRSKAMDMTDKPPITSYDPTSDEYARIKALPKKAYWGQSFLVLVRGQTETPFELYFGNASGRQESDKMKPFLARGKRQPQTATLNIKYREGKEFSYHVPVVVKCSDPITEAPDMGTIMKEREKFLNPPAAEVEVEVATEGRAR